VSTRPVSLRPVVAGRVSWVRRARMVVAAGLAAVLVVTLSQQPVLAAPVRHYRPPLPPAVASVPVRRVPASSPSGAAGLAPASARPAAVWPVAGSAQVTVPAAGADSVSVVAGALPVTVTRPAVSGGPGGTHAAPPSGAVGLRVSVLDRAAAAAAGVRGVLLRLDRTDTAGGKARPGGAGGGVVRLGVDYRAFRTAFGADWSARLRLVSLPVCALDAPADPRCAPVVLPSANSSAAGVVSALVGVPAVGGGVLVAAAAGASGAAGSFSATSLSASSSWSAGGSSGDFSWSYPVRVPPGAGGPAPGVALSYSAQSVDGRQAASNNQPSWVGEGFEAWPGGFIERRYGGCADDMGADAAGGAANNTVATGDECWVTDNAVLTLAGHSGELLYNAAEGRWHLRDDDGTRVQRLTGAANGDNNGEYWVVSTPDGVQYWFGKAALPGSGSARTDSVWTVAVYGNHPGEPCHASTFAASSCTQAYRWNLDYVIDTSGNTASYWYQRETNKYAANLQTNSPVSYVRGGVLLRVVYGTRQDAGVDSLFTGGAPAQVVFGTGDRCLSGCGTHDGVHWPDTPWDLECTGATCANYGPTFWTTRRLTTITTQIDNGATSVERWTLTQSFPDPGDTTRAGLWLDRISHQGLVGGVASVPDMVFTPVQMDNRVDTSTDGWPAMKWLRLSRIDNETGGSTSVVYSPADCVAGSRMPAAADTNTLRCYPVKWTPEGYSSPVTDYFNKYVVSTVYEIDNVGGVPPSGSPRVVHTYSYGGSPAWHYTDDDGLVQAVDKTWSVWRGYATVGVTTGDAGEQTYTQTRYFRGMHGDKLASGTRTVTVTGAGVPTVNDEDAYAGMERESIVYNGPGGAEVSRQVTEPWQSAPTASRTIHGDTVTARYTGDLATHDRGVLDGGRGTRVRSVRNTFDGYGMVVAVDDSGDDAVAGDEQCSRSTFEPRNTSAWILDAPQRVVTYATTCAAAADPSTLGEAQVVSDTRTWYDGATAYGTAPTQGRPTLTEVASAWNAGNPTYVTTGTTGYDANGRAVLTHDAMGQPTSTTYTPAAGLVRQTTVTNALGHASTVTFDPAWGLPVSTVDPNGKRTDQVYDGLGRLGAVWSPGRDKATQTANYTYDYQIHNNAPSAVVSRRLNPAGNAYLTSYALFDGLLRARQTQTLSPSAYGGRLLTDQFYDSAGRPVKEYGAYYNQDPPGTTLVTATLRTDVPDQTRTVYDGVGRVVASVFQPYNTERWRTSTGYGGDRVDVTPPTGGTATSTVGDVFGRTVQVRQYQAPAPVGSYDATSYGYNGRGQLAAVTDPAGNTWGYGYDLRGRQVTAADPDKGTTTTVYNDAGSPTMVTDARGISIGYGYDALQRRVSMYQRVNNKSVLRGLWAYDSVAKGQLSTSERYTNGNASSPYESTKILSYDDAYHVTGQSIRIAASETGLAGTYEFYTSYNVDGSYDGSSYPPTADLPGEGTNTLYDGTTGLPHILTNYFNNVTGSYVSDTVYGALGLVDQLTLYTGYYSGTGSRTYLSYRYELETRRLTGIHTTVESRSPYSISDLGYSYDDAGNVTRIADTAAPGGVDTQCLRYDYLDRLASAWTPASGDCAPAPSSAALGGPAPYWQDWSYDKAGDRTGQTDHATTAGGPQTTTSYTYPAPGGPQPHALTSTTTNTGSGATTVGYSYDVVGNTLTRPTAAGDTQTLTWDPEGHLASSTDASGTTSYLYDADGNRVVSIDPAGKTLYLPGEEVRYTTATNTATCTRYYQYNGQTIASRTGAGLTWLAGDQQGTADVAVTADSQVYSIRRQTPFGSPRGARPQWPNPHGFVGGYQDATGLTHLGAREYDPNLGRFVSLDPVQDLTDPQQWNGYAYAGNNPVTGSDPSGLRTEYQYYGAAGEAARDSQSDEAADKIVRDARSHRGCSRDPSECGVQGAKPAPKPHKHWWQSAAHWVSQHRGQIAGIVAGVVVGVACEAAVGWTGVGAVACGALAGAVGSVVGDLVEGGHSFGDIVKDAVVGAVTGALAGGLGVAVGAAAKAAGGVVRGAVRAAARGAARGGGEAVESGGGRLATAAGRVGRGCSFAPATPVLLAGGGSKPISQVRLGDRVLATDPTTDQTGAQPVTALHVNQDLALADLQIRLGDGHTAVLHTTQNHPFWDDTTHRWTTAADLHPGDRLHTTSGAATITAVHSYLAPQAMYNLTVNHTHTYYVLAGNTPVLVHNDNPGGMVGANGTQITSSTVWLRGPYRIDVENPNPGVRPGQMHFQDQATGAKYLYNHDTGKFDGMPNSLQKELDKKMPDYKKAIAKGNRFLGMSGC
jgi:RHS repeat-associated protein